MCGKALRIAWFGNIFYWWKSCSRWRAECDATRKWSAEHKNQDGQRRLDRVRRCERRIILRPHVEFLELCAGDYVPDCYGRFSATYQLFRLALSMRYWLVRLSLHGIRCRQHWSSWDDQSVDLWFYQRAMCAAEQHRYPSQPEPAGFRDFGH